MMTRGVMCRRQAGNTKISEFLLKDFGREDAKASAAKNAFALLGHHRCVRTPATWAEALSTRVVLYSCHSIQIPT